MISGNKVVCFLQVFSQSTLSSLKFLDQLTLLSDICQSTSQISLYLINIFTECKLQSSYLSICIILSSLQVSSNLSLKVQQVISNLLQLLSLSVKFLIQVCINTLQLLNCLIVSFDQLINLCQLIVNISLLLCDSFCILLNFVSNNSNLILHILLNLQKVFCNLSDSLSISISCLLSSSSSISSSLSICSNYVDSFLQICISLKKTRNLLLVCCYLRVKIIDRCLNLIEGCVNNIDSILYIFLSSINSCNLCCLCLNISILLSICLCSLNSCVKVALSCRQCTFQSRLLLLESSKFLCKVLHFLFYQLVQFSGVVGDFCAETVDVIIVVLTRSHCTYGCHCKCTHKQRAKILSFHTIKFN